jgi:hypothetical protein
MLDIQGEEPPGWRPVLVEAERSFGKRDLYQAKFLYASAGHIASLRQDWEGLLAAACGMNKLGGLDAYSIEIHTLLAGAVLAAENKQSKAGMHAVSKAFAMIGEDGLGSAILSRVQESWVDQTNRSLSEAVWGSCWEPR